MEMVGEANQLMTVHEVARTMRVHDTTVRRWIYNEQITGAIGIPCKGKRHNWRIPRSALAAMLGIAEENIPAMPSEQSAHVPLLQG